MPRTTLREAPVSGALPFPPGPAFAWDPIPWPGEARMAADAAAFAAAELAPPGGQPRLTFWNWATPTISLGRLETAAAVLDADAVRQAALPVVIRPTGGRAILHVHEWTYSALVPLDHARLGGSLAASMSHVVALIAEALEEAFSMGLDMPQRDAPRAPRAAGGPAGACFASVFRHELTRRGRKLMGSAQRRGRHVLLQQGSLLIGPGHERLVRLLAGPANTRAAGERALAAGAVTLEEILGSAPDPEPFRGALARRWAAAAGPAAQG